MMNRLLAVGVVVFTTCGVVAQGRFMFANRCTFRTPPVDAKLFELDGVTPLEGPAYWAQADAKRVEDPDSSYFPAHPAVSFRSGANAGYIAPVEVATPFPAGTTITVQVRAWEASGGTSDEAAVAAGKIYGVSNGVTLTVTEPADEAPYMIGLAGLPRFPTPPYPEAPTMTGPKEVQVWFSLVPLRLTITWPASKAPLEWTSPAVLQSSDGLVPGDWQDVSGATSPYEVEPANAQRFYRLRRPRRARYGKHGAEPRAAPGVRRFTLHPPRIRGRHLGGSRTACAPAPSLRLKGDPHRSRGERPRDLCTLVGPRPGRANRTTQSTRLTSALFRPFRARGPWERRSVGVAPRLRWCRPWAYLPGYDHASRWPEVRVSMVTTSEERNPHEMHFTALA